MTYLEVWLEIHHDLVVLAKVCAVAFAVGLDVLAVSVAAGVMQLGRGASIRVGIAFAAAEISMQVIGYALGTSVGRMLGKVAAYGGFALLGLIGAYIIYGSSGEPAEPEFDFSGGPGLLIAALSISLDSLGVGIALPGVPIPVTPLIIAVSISTISFTMLGLSLGAQLGRHHQNRAERLAGIMLIILAAVFTFQHWSA
jgi:putative Mn2+ efflux pump MntP